ncbi:MAG: hypothetical protein ACJ8GN_26505 [Longimicrobiaceae bacterium]
MRRLRAALPALLIAAAGCAASAPDGGVVRRDSAGVAVVENRAPRWASGRGWRVDTARAVPLDLSPDDAAAVAVLPGGAFAVADDRGRIAWHDRRGRAKRAIALPDSPAVGALLVQPGGGLIAWDADRLAAIEVGADGRPGPARAYEALLPRGSVAPLGALGDGSVVVSVSDRRIFNANPLPTRDTVPVFRLGPGGPHPRILTIPGPEEITWGGAGGTIRIDAPFARNAFSTVSGDRVWVADARTAELRGYDASGGLRTLVRAPVRGDSADPAVVTGWRQRLRGLAHGYLSDDERQRFESALQIPSTWPPFAAVLAGARGELWVKAGSAPGSEGRWNVFDATGRWLGEVRVPASHELIAAGDGYLIARRDDRLTLIPLKT